MTGRVRVLAGEPAHVVGAGVVLSRRAVLTCWHVVEDAAGPAAGLAVAEPDGAVVEAAVTWSAPIGPEGQGDLAVLTTRAPLTVPPARLADCGEAEIDVRVIGHPIQSPAQVLAAARLVGPADPVTGWRQMDRLSSATVAVDRGFSGAGVFDPDGRVVGLMVARAKIGQSTVGWMIPVAVWRRLLPTDLLNLVAATPRIDPLSAEERDALARALAAVPTMIDAMARAELIAALPSAIGLRVRVTNRLLLDCRELIATTLDTDGGFAALYRRLSEREDAASIALREFRAVAVAARLLSPDRPRRDEEDDDTSDDAGAGR